MRLIDADALIDIFEDRLEKIRNRYGDYSGEAGACAGALHLVRVQPTIEPERTKGNWVGIDDEPCDEWECDRCGFIYDGSPPPNFCENCGADMRRR